MNKTYNLEEQKSNELFSYTPNAPNCNFNVYLTSTIIQRTVY